MPDFSGMAWLGSTTDGDATVHRFLVVHDAKADDEADLPRVSLVTSPAGPDGPGWEPLDLDFPVRGVSNDLESAARVPDRDAVLLVESGDGGDRPGAGSADPDAGIYYATFDDTSVEVVSYTKWPGTPEPLDNVEATAVAAAGDLLYFLYAERASGQDQTTIHWTILEIADDGTLSFGTEWGSMPFTRPGPQGARPASSLEVGADGRIFVGSAFDADDDNGPFASAVWEVGTWTTDGDPRIAPRPEPAGVGHANGFKIESIATSADGDEIVFVGVDDENYGGTLRPLLSEADTEGV